ncbi:MAG: M20 metallopeptidase family protein [Pseudonocardia sp.]
MTPELEPAMSDLELLRWIRRTMHRWPELGHEEHRTSAFLEGVLGGFGLRFSRPAPTSLAVSLGPSGRPTVAFRADLDAIARTEETGLSFASERPGVMHACGHDGHTAALVVLARRLARRQPIDPVLLIFQQAEEVHPSGARRVIEGLGPGAWPAEQIYGLHLWPELPEVTIGLRTGAFMPGISGVTATFRALQGRSHGTQVDAGAGDALNAVNRFCHMVELVVPAGRCPTSEQPVVVHVGMAQAGEAPNQPAASGSVRATMRWLDHDARVRYEKDLRQIAEDVTAETGVAVDVCIENDVRPLVHNAALAVNNVASACERVGLNVAANYPRVPLGVSDDFGCYLEHVPGALFLVGCGTGNDQADLHDTKFDFREEALLPVVDVLELLARQDFDSVVNS